MRKTSLRVGSVRAEIRAEHLSSTSLQHYCYAEPPRWWWRRWQVWKQGWICCKHSPIPVTARRLWVQAPLPVFRPMFLCFPRHVEAAEVMRSFIQIIPVGLCNNVYGILYSRKCCVQNNSFKGETWETEHTYVRVSSLFKIIIRRVTYSSQDIIHSWSWALLEEPPIVHLLKNFRVFYGTRRFISVFTRDLHWFLSWSRSIQSIPSRPVTQRSILILSTHLLLCLPSGLFWLSHQWIHKQYYA
jgi:hypothetical protein